ncbi:hypothetical protein FACS189459_2810 [Bacilli bacterium]|nr:hypothetical protein FACS189459_2810 [Bacilli bacterium]GHU51744.1 hypothetical protein FACS189496_0620 [Bacilli bacterium]
MLNPFVKPCIDKFDFLDHTCIFDVPFLNAIYIANMISNEAAIHLNTPVHLVEFLKCFIPNIVMHMHKLTIVIPIISKNKLVYAPKYIMLSGITKSPLISYSAADGENIFLNIIFIPKVTINKIKIN